MARVIINKAQMARILQDQVQTTIDQKAENVLRALKEKAPRDTGNFANSLRIERTFERGKIITRIISTDPNVKEILHGTRGGYSRVPPWGPKTAFGGWGDRHGFTTKKSMYQLAKRVAIHGTKPAGSFTGESGWIQEAVREMNR